MFQGDSGGPLSYDHKGQHVLVGVTSYGLPDDLTFVGCASVSLKEALTAPETPAFAKVANLEHQLN